MASTADLLLNILSRSDKRAINETADDLDKLGTKADDAGKKFSGMAKESGHLDEEIAKTKTRIRELGEEFDATGKKDLLPQLRRERGNLVNLEKIKKDLEVAGTEGGQSFAQGLLNSVSGFAPTGLVQWLVAGAVAAAPAVGAAVNAGVLLGLGGGALAAGIAGALQDPEVKATWADFGDFLKSGLADAASSFVQPMEAAAVTLRGDLSQVFTVLSHDLDVLAPALTRVADGLGGFLVNMLPGLDNALQASGPLLMALGDELPRLGTTVSFFFDQIAQGGPGAVSFFRDLMTVTEGTIGTLGIMTSSLSKFYDVFREGSIHDQLEASGLMGWLEPLVSDIQKKKKADEDGAQAAANHRARMTDQAFAAQQAKMSIDQLSAAIDKEVSAALRAKDSHLAFNQAVLDLKQSVKENGTTLDDTTAKGIANSQMLLRMAQAAEADRQSVLQQTGSVQQATGVFDAHMQQVYATAKALGFDKTQVDNLIGSVQSIPHESTTDIQLKGANVAEDDIRTYKNFLDSIPTNKTTYVNTVYQETNLGFIGQSYGSSGSSARPYRYGGVVPASQGLVSGVLPPRNPGTMVLAGEPGTKGEVFAPLSGISQQRAMSLAGTIGDAYGFPVGGAGGGSGRSYTINVHVPVGAAPAQVGASVVDAIKAYERVSGKSWRS